MGSMIELAVGRLAIDYGKNEFFNHYSSLFQEKDVSVAPYEYVRDAKKGEKEDDWRNRIYVEWKRGLCKPLWQVIDRINLLGYTPEFAKMSFDHIAKSNDTSVKKGTFRQLKKLFAGMDVSKLLFDEQDENRGFEKEFIRQIRLTVDPGYIMDEYSTLQEPGLECLDPYTVLHLLSENPNAKYLPVYWAFDDIEDGGYAPLSSFVRDLDPPNKFLIVTEGSSDAKIIKHAFDLLKPHVTDFFTFVDMEEGYPFSGTGNMTNFIKGLISISIQNNIVVLFDNDAEGIDTYNRCMKLRIPTNMRILRLPSLPEFKKFKTAGPTGSSKADINSQAVGIECFLQLDTGATIRWTSYKKDLDSYQGELIEKDKYKKAFLVQTAKLANYDYSKLERLLQMILHACTKMQEEGLIRTLHNLKSILYFR